MIKQQIKILVLIIVNRISQIKHNKINLSYSFSFPLILSSLDINITDADSSFTQFSYGVFLLSLIALICFINIIGFMIGYILIQRGNYEIKYPKLSRFIKYYKNSTLIYITIEVLLCLICLLLLVFLSLLYVYSSINKT